MRRRCPAVALCARLVPPAVQSTAVGSVGGTVYRGWVRRRYSVPPEGFSSLRFLLDRRYSVPRLGPSAVQCTAVGSVIGAVYRDVSDSGAVSGAFFRYEVIASQPISATVQRIAVGLSFIITLCLKGDQCINKGAGSLA